MTDTNTTAAQPLDLDKLEALALAYAYENGEHWYNLHQIADGITYESAADFIAGVSPATVLALIAQARAAQPVVCATCGGSKVDPGGLPVCRDCAAQPESATGTTGATVIWPSKKFVHERIATLMAEIGMPDDTPLWNAFSRFEADLRSRVEAAPASAQPADLLEAARETLRMHDEVTGGQDYGYISPNLRAAVAAAEASAQPADKFDPDLSFQAHMGEPGAVAEMARRRSAQPDRGDRGAAVAPSDAKGKADGTALEYRTCCEHPDCTTCAGRGGFYRVGAKGKADAANAGGMYEAAMLAVERIRGCAATYIEDHAKDSYPGQLGLRPQDVAVMWAQEIHDIDAKSYLDEAIIDLNVTQSPAASATPAMGTFQVRVDAENLNSGARKFTVRVAPASATSAADAKDAALTNAEAYTLRRLIECAERLDERPRPMCRDCADENGTCPNSGLECDMGKLFADAKSLHDKLVRAAGQEAADAKDAVLTTALAECKKVRDTGATREFRAGATACINILRAAMAAAPSSEKGGA